MIDQLFTMILTERGIGGEIISGAPPSDTPTEIVSKEVVSGMKAPEFEDDASTSSQDDFDTDVDDDVDGDQDQDRDQDQNGDQNEDADFFEESKSEPTNVFGQMMFVSGETAEPSAETTTLIEEIVRQQVIEMVSAHTLYLFITY